MKNLSSIAPAVLVILLLSLIGCSQSFLTQGRKALDEGRYESASNYLELALQEDPNNPNVLKALGRLQYHQGNIPEARQNLAAAQTILTDDPQIALYLGFCAEADGDYAAAATGYERFLETSPKSRVADQVRGRLMYVKNESLREQVAQAVKTESSLTTEEPQPLTVAVLPYYVGDATDPQLQAIADGLAATLWYDLATIDELTMVERLQVNYLMQELEIAEAGLTSGESAPRVGRIVSAGHLVNASLSTPAENRLSLDAALVTTTTSEYRPAYNSNNELSKILGLQKEMTLAILDSLGVDVKGSRRRDLAETPTDSYEAFLAFSKGVSMYDQGDYVEAKQFFDQARSIDPRFSLAGQFASESQLLMNSSMNLGQFDGMVLANIESSIESGFSLIDEIRAIGSPETNPRVEDEPTEGSTTATVSGEVH
jgi:tetratricopeptide (TPR) repeat protein